MTAKKSVKNPILSRLKSLFRKDKYPIYSYSREINTQGDIKPDYTALDIQRLKDEINWLTIENGHLRTYYGTTQEAYNKSMSNFYAQQSAMLQRQSGSIIPYIAYPSYPRNNFWDWVRNLFY